MWIFNENSFEIQFEVNILNDFSCEFIFCWWDLLVLWEQDSISQFKEILREPMNKGENFRHYKNYSIPMKNWIHFNFPFYYLRSCNYNFWFLHYFHCVILKNYSFFNWDSKFPFEKSLNCVEKKDNNLLFCVFIPFLHYFSWIFYFLSCYFMKFKFFSASSCVIFLMQMNNFKFNFLVLPSVDVADVRLKFEDFGRICEFC